MRRLKRQSLVSQVESQIRKLIQSDAFQEGEKLPTESMLCEQYGISRPTVREALRSLQAQGYIEIRAGSGAFLRSKEATVDNANNWFNHHSCEAQDYLEIRLALETLAVRLATERAKEEEVFALYGVEALFEKAVDAGDYAQMAYYDETFHKRIAAAAHNPLLDDLSNSVNRALVAFRNQVFILNKGSAAKGEHTAILEALQQRNAVKAEHFMREHLNNNIRIVEGYLPSKNESSTATAE